MSGKNGSMIVNHFNNPPRPVLRPRTVTRGDGMTLTVGDCSLCGRRLYPSGANKTGVRCRYDGAQYDLAGNFLHCSGKDSATGKAWKMVPRIVQTEPLPPYPHADVISAVLHQLNHGEASDLLDGTAARDVDAMRAAIKDLRWCREQLNRLPKAAKGER